MLAASPLRNVPFPRLHALPFRHVCRSDGCQALPIRMIRAPVMVATRLAGEVLPFPNRGPARAPCIVPRFTPELAVVVVDHLWIGFLLSAEPP